MAASIFLHHLPGDAADALADEAFRPTARGYRDVYPCPGSGIVGGKPTPDPQTWSLIRTRGEGFLRQTLEFSSLPAAIFHGSKKLHHGWWGKVPPAR